MTQAFQCPHCRSVLPSSAPGLVRCAACRRAARIPDPALLEKQRADRKHAAMLVGVVIAFVYGLPLLVTVAYCVFSMLFYGLLAALGLGAAVMQ